MAFSSILTTNKAHMASPLLILGLLSSLVISGVQSIGVCYGRNGNNLPPASEVVQLLKSNGITGVRIYEPNQPTLQALKGSNIEVTIGILNQNLQPLTNPATATEWVQNNVRAYSPDVKFRYIAVGNEVHPGNEATNHLLPAIQNIHNAIKAANLQDQIKVSTAIDTTLLANTFPPSNAEFSGPASSFIKPIITFLANNGSPLLANIYTYFGRVDTPNDISLPYALFTSPGVVFQDQNTKLDYRNLFDALLDSLYTALEKAGAPNLQVVVSESGWPSAGGTEASVENAGTYYKNFINHVKNGTPKKKGAIEAYLFALFDENQKGGDEIEKHFGIFNANKQQKYQLSFN
ncbi:glucan endo-1,3-beta-glucosidase [Ziziphus jujuba]|uniref:glucan endo-1,3-beta-D-glucosidase n=1 Tax=Ziziphus jujuba TaxID=326968 RepID=A0A6P3ZKR0_ZIZJJ|nr:glucan endo-1,3-beta-glucosidase [Ziziphus jujuba]